MGVPPNHLTSSSHLCGVLSDVQLGLVLIQSMVLNHLGLSDKHLKMMGNPPIQSNSLVHDG